MLRRASWWSEGSSQSDEELDEVDSNVDARSGNKEDEEQLVAHTAKRVSAHRDAGDTANEQHTAH